LAVNTCASRRHIASHIKTTAGQQGISGESLKATPIPLPPPEEVTEILARVRADDDHIKTELRENQDTCQQLRQSVLKAAFEGHHVEQDPRDEPAELLLARLNNGSASSARVSGRRRNRARAPAAAEA
jgi:type I restriction enzyme S subunit